MNRPDSVEKVPSPMDAHLGMRIRGRRQSLEMTPQDLSRALAVDDDSVTRMETGLQRLSACQLHRLSQVLDVPISYFFENAPREQDIGFPGTAFAAPLAAEDEDSLETLDLLRAFLAISDAEKRKRVTQLAQELAGTS
ncbi:MAG: hypothetical protein BGO92_09550 [Magnetospirillum sp. 64-120]|nr:MAG: hypothetical protein BGO92_09550 [Magnetospirillum sp. 64-120]